MTTIRLSTEIQAPIGRCFDLSRSVDLHILSGGHTKERVVGGRATGLVEKDDVITWEAVHFGIKQKLTIRIMEMRPSYYFSEQMVKGAFKSMYHEHHFTPTANGTEVTDVFYYDTPFGIFGKLFDGILLERHMSKFLEDRNNLIESAAEGTAWIKILG